MDRNKKYFIDFLLHSGEKNVIFEPFISKTLIETLIWRRGYNLWNSTEHYIETLISLSERTSADVIFADMRIFSSENKKFELIEYINKYEKEIAPIGFGAICKSAEDIKTAESSESISALAVYGNLHSKSLPVIRMDGDIETAILRGDSGWYAPCSAERYLEKFGSKIKILGGLGVEWIEDSSPIDIYKRTEETARIYGRNWACGSGGTISDAHYLELISLLGAFKRIRV